MRRHHAVGQMYYSCVESYAKFFAAQPRSTASNEATKAKAIANELTPTCFHVRSNYSGTAKTPPCLIKSIQELRLTHGTNSTAAPNTLAQNGSLLRLLYGRDPLAS